MIKWPSEFKTLRWEHLMCDSAEASALAADMRMSSVVARLLCLRGFREIGDASRFLSPSIEHLHDPFQLTDLPKAVDRIMKAIARKERIAVHGDYDVDGVTATVIVRRVLELLGADVIHFIPDRIRDGYGLEAKAIDRFNADGVEVVISVDCGIRSEAAARRAKELGIDLIITDHHEPDLTLPKALSVINPKRHDCVYPDKDLSGVGVALKLVQALCLKTEKNKWLPSFIKIAAIGTLADVVPLIGENRVIAKLGLESLSSGSHTIGLRTLLESSGLIGKPVDGFHVNFMLAPKINAAGRMSTPDLATRLLLASDESMAVEVREMAEQLDAENMRRRREEDYVLKLASQAIDTDPGMAKNKMIVIGGDGWHRGVIGIVASRVVEMFYRPTIILAIDGPMAYGSGRSIKGFDLLSSLESCSDLFLRFGGHRQAVGLTMEASRIKEFNDRINKYADLRLSPNELTPRLKIDGPLPLPVITDDVVEGIGRMAPFGIGNSRPVFYANGIEIVDGPRVLKDRHLKMTVKQDGRVFRAVAWRAASRVSFLEQHRSSLNLAFSLSENRYRGETSVELSIADAQKTH